MIIPAGRALSGDAALYRYLRRSVAGFDGAARFRRRLGDAGFTGVHSETVPGWQRGIVHTFLASRPPVPPTPARPAGPTASAGDRRAARARPAGRSGTPPPAGNPTPGGWPAGRTWWWPAAGSPGWPPRPGWPSAGCG